MGTQRESNGEEVRTLPGGLRAPPPPLSRLQMGDKRLVGTAIGPHRRLQLRHPPGVIRERQKQAEKGKVKAVQINTFCAAGDALRPLDWGEEAGWGGGGERALLTPFPYTVAALKPSMDLWS